MEPGRHSSGDAVGATVAGCAEGVALPTVGEAEGDQVEVGVVEGSVEGADVEPSQPRKILATTALVNMRRSTPGMLNTGAMPYTKSG
jgi:hypothetical protein